MRPNSREILKARNDLMAHIIAIVIVTPITIAIKEGFFYILIISITISTTIKWVRYIKITE